MAIPDYETLMLPLLRLVSSGPHRVRDLSEALADQFELTPDQRAQLLPSGKGVTVIHSRTGWAKTYLKAAGLVTQPARGMVAITDRGLAILREPIESIDNDVLSHFPEFIEFKQRKRAVVEAESPENQASASTVAASRETPDERIASAAAEIELTLRDDLLARIKSGPPAFFERVVLDLLRALGYGAGSGGMAEVTGRSGDGGIDGIIDEDRLGLDRVYVQAKRFNDASVGAPVIRDFIGALHMRGATKGVLLTTSSFNRGAEEAARANPSMRIVLIDGERLAALMVRYDVGVRTDRTIQIKKPDLDYFEPDDA
jgi:restriction system protein